jgi:RNA polymerase sigma-70 factor (ECF subfamily)
MDEAGLIAAARSGDEDAFAELYRQHTDYIGRIGRSILRTSDLDDLCQDTFLLAFTRIHSFEENCSLRTWISRIAVNQCRAILRKRRQAKNGDAHLVPIDAAKKSDWAPDGSMFGSEDLQLEATIARLDLTRLLRVLNPTQRRILEMAYLEDIPDLEIAEILGIPLGSVKRKIHYAKRRVRDVHKNR